MQFLLNERFGDGRDLAYSPGSGTDSPTDSACTGTSGTKILSATNAGFQPGQIILCHQSQGTGAGNYELNVIASYSTGTITTKYALANTYGTGAQVLVLKQYNSVNIAGGVTLTAKAWNGTTGGILALLCNGTTTIAGTLSGSQQGFRGARQNHTSGLSEQGEGTLGLGSNISSANGNGGGGDADFNAGAGGGGGNGIAGVNGAGSGGGIGGGITGAADLTTMTFGGGGGMAYDNTSFAPVPGSGGGIIIIISKNIVVTGSITCNGGNGGVSPTFNDGSGGSAGGSILFKGQTISLGTNLVTATGGTGGVGSKNGGNGGDGRIHADCSIPVSGSTSPTLNSSQTQSFSSPAFGFMI